MLEKLDKRLKEAQEMLDKVIEQRRTIEQYRVNNDKAGIALEANIGLLKDLIKEQEEIEFSGAQEVDTSVEVVESYQNDTKSIPTDSTLNIIGVV